MRTLALMLSLFLQTCPTPTPKDSGDTEDTALANTYIWVGFEINFETNMTKTCSLEAYSETDAIGSKAVNVTDVGVQAVTVNVAGPRPVWAIATCCGPRHCEVVEWWEDQASSQVYCMYNAVGEGMTCLY